MFLGAFLEFDCCAFLAIVLPQIFVLELLLTFLALKAQRMQGAQGKPGDFLGWDVLLATVRATIRFLKPFIDAGLTVEFFTLLAHGGILKFVLIGGARMGLRAHSVKADGAQEILLEGLGDSCVWREDRPTLHFLFLGRDSFADEFIDFLGCYLELRFLVIQLYHT